MPIFENAKSVLAGTLALVALLFGTFKGVLNNAPPGTEQWNVPELLSLVSVAVFLVLMIVYRGRITRRFRNRATAATILVLLLGLFCYAGFIWQSSENVFEYGGSRHIRGDYSEQGEDHLRQSSGSLETAINRLGGLATARPFLWTSNSERYAKYQLLGWYFASSVLLAAAVLSAVLLVTLLWREKRRKT